jgi:hypothetical protein
MPREFQEFFLLSLLLRKRLWQNFSEFFVKIQKIAIKWNLTPKWKFLKRNKCRKENEINAGGHV